MHNTKWPKWRDNAFFTGENVVRLDESESLIETSRTFDREAFELNLKAQMNCEIGTKGKMEYQIEVEVLDENDNKPFLIVKTPLEMFAEGDRLIKVKINKINSSRS